MNKHKHEHGADNADREWRPNTPAKRLRRQRAEAAERARETEALAREIEREAFLGCLLLGMLGCFVLGCIALGVALLLMWS